MSHLVRRTIGSLSRLPIAGNAIEPLKVAFHRMVEARRLIWSTPALALQGPDYDAYWRDKRRHGMGTLSPFQKQRADWILPRIETGSTILDVGCGDGGVLLYLLRHRDLAPIGAEISEYALEFLESRGIATVKSDIRDPESLARLPDVDHVILFEVLEHVPNPETFLKQIERKARKSIFFSFPNTGYFPYRVRMLLGSFVMQWRLYPGEHLRFWTYSDLKWWLNELGYENRSSIHVYEGIPLLNRVWGSLFGMAFVGEIRAA